MVTIERCDVWALARKRGELTGELGLADAERLAEMLFDTVGALRFRLVGLTDARGRAAARLELDGIVRTRCDRCGGPVEVPIHERAEFYFVSDERELAQLPIDEAPEEPLLGSQHFDVVALAEDQAILALPISPRHEDCASPLVEGTLESDEESKTHRPFESLAGLRKRKK